LWWLAPVDKSGLSGGGCIRLPVAKLVITLGDQNETRASTGQMPPLSDHTQENLTSFIEGGLEIADDFLEDAVVHLQLRHFYLAAESIQDAFQTMNIVERYFPNVAERDQLVRYQASVSTTRERVHALEQSITQEGTSRP
jgi:hypothetical protein